MAATPDVRPGPVTSLDASPLRKLFWALHSRYYRRFHGKVVINFRPPDQPGITFEEVKKLDELEER